MKNGKTHIRRFTVHGVWLVLFCDAVQEEEQSVGDVYL